MQFTSIRPVFFNAYVIFLKNLISCNMNMEIEHRGRVLAVEMSWRGVVFRFVFKGKEKAATI